MHSVHEVDADPEYFPAMQSMQEAMLVAAVVPEYVPAMQSVHVEMLVAAIVPE